MPAPSAHLNSQKIGRYELVRRLAVGGMGELYLGRLSGAADWQKWVAVKTILPHLAQDPAHVRRFLDEGKIAVSLSHGNIVSVLDLIEESGRLHLVMEYVDGWDLRRLMAQLRQDGTPLPPSVALFVLHEAARGLGYVHTRTDASGRPLCIVHRDVSPSNILLSRDGQVKVTDFGIAVARARLDQTLTGELRGKFAYMSPEQARGETVTAASDTWSLAVIAAEMFSGKRMWQGQAEVAILSAVQAGKTPPIRQLAPQLPAGVTNILELALAADAQTRPAPITAFLSNLRQAAGEAGWAMGDSHELERFTTKTLGSPPTPEVLAEAATLEERLSLELDRMSGTDSAHDERTPTAPPPTAQAAAADSSQAQRYTGQRLGAAAHAAPPRAGEVTGSAPSAPGLPAQLPADHPITATHTQIVATPRSALIAGVSAGLIVLAGLLWFFWPGYIEISSEEVKAEVWLDGDSIGFTPLTARVRAGRHSVELNLDGYTPARHRVDVRRGERVDLASQLTPVDAGPTFEMVAFNSLPPGATVEIDGSEPFLAGNSRRVATDQEFELKMSLDGYEPARERRIIERGETIVTVELVPLPELADEPGSDVEAGAPAASDTGARPATPGARAAASEAATARGTPEADAAPATPRRPEQAAAPDIVFAQLPASARLWIDGREADPTAAQPWPRGRASVTIRAEAPGYLPVIIDIAGSNYDGAPIALPWASASQEEGILEVRFVKEPMVGTIYVDGVEIGHSERLSETWPVPAGARQVEVIHRGRSLRASSIVNVPSGGQALFQVEWEQQATP